MINSALKTFLSTKGQLKSVACVKDVRGKKRSVRKQKQKKLQVMCVNTQPLALLTQRHTHTIIRQVNDLQ